ncbi:hypothetical protein R1sor_011227 [Riccia sorocarpa]|uniref:Reverse transcriptase zinc-binding domain-containing protein n=1 Tax=Riccia sorocarpa TaxID=122646 RepID=A0ABD3I4E9_9MARC
MLYPSMTEVIPLEACCRYYRIAIHGAKSQYDRSDCSQHADHDARTAIRTTENAKRRLTWRPNEGAHPTSATPTFVCSILSVTQTFDEQETKQLQQLFRKAKKTNTDQLKGPNGEVMTLTDYCRITHVPIPLEADPVLDKLETLLPMRGSTEMQWQKTAGWKWTEIDHTLEKTWTLTTKQWRTLIHVQTDDSTELNWRWEVNDTPEEWKARWTNLWKGGATDPTKLRFWRFLRKGYFTNDKARKWRIDTGICQRCRTEIETLPPTIWTCPSILERQRWILWLIFDDAERTVSNVAGEPMMVVVDKALQAHKNNQAPLLLLLAIWRINWAERNDRQFNERSTYRGVNCILNEIAAEVERLTFTKGMSDRHKDRLNTAKCIITFWKLETKRWLKGASRRNPFINQTEDHNNHAKADSAYQTRPWPEETLIRWDQQEREESRHTATTTEARPRRTRGRIDLTEENEAWNEDVKQKLHDTIHSWFDTCHRPHAEQNDQITAGKWNDSHAPTSWDKTLEDEVQFDSVEQLIEEILSTNQFNLDSENSLRDTQTETRVND